MKIETMADLLEVVNEQNVDVLVADLTMWLALVVAARTEGLTPVPVFEWFDDGEPGIRGVNLQVRTRP